MTELLVNMRFFFYIIFTVKSAMATVTHRLTSAYIHNYLNISEQSKYEHANNFIILIIYIYEKILNLITLNYMIMWNYLI